jgi:hypothetical protein
MSTVVLALAGAAVKMHSRKESLFLHRIRRKHRYLLGNRAVFPFFYAFFDRAGRMT